ncbi:hypothetical protein [Oceanobacillus bengalensis]|uniref:Uncharacterized protein n=2 Tax=Oceanobacillus bengalensis TaxID=1435466 RepID=A0A494Z7M7_9BACI|nr:hypothetical protein D8M05_00450 [Oceanobacillus bengalensis]
MITSILSVVFLTGCNTDESENIINENNDENEPDNVDYRPVKYDDETNTNEINEDYMEDKKPGAHNENPGETDMELEKGSDREFDKNRGAE